MYKYSTHIHTSPCKPPTLGICSQGGNLLLKMPHFQNMSLRPFPCEHVILVRIREVVHTF